MKMTSAIKGYIVLCFGAILGTLASQQIRVQQTVLTGNAGAVVVLIPGFPVESVLLGLLAGLVAVVLMRIWQRRRPPVA